MKSLSPKSILCVVAHPDDIEVMIGGSLAKWIENGTEAHYLICTDGQKGTNSASDESISLTRASEQQRAAELLGITNLHHLDYIDGDVEYSKKLVRDIVRYIRMYKPQVVFTIDPTFLYSARFNYPNHRDHRVIGEAVFDAVYPCARDASSFPELLEEGLEPHCTETLLMGNYDKPNYFEDISDFFEKKMTALKMHESQFGNGEFITERMDEISTAFGKQSNCERAESFVRLDMFTPKKES